MQQPVRQSWNIQNPSIIACRAYSEPCHIYDNSGIPSITLGSQNPGTLTILEYSEP